MNTIGSQGRNLNSSMTKTGKSNQVTNDDSNYRAKYYKERMLCEQLSKQIMDLENQLSFYGDENNKLREENDRNQSDLMSYQNKRNKEIDTDKELFKDMAL